MRYAFRLLGLGAMIAVTTPAYAQTTPMTGMDLYNWCGSQITEIQGGCEMYLFGFFEGYAVAQQEGQTGDVLLCLPDRALSMAQLRLIAQKTMQDHPDILHYPASVIAGRSLVDTFKCKAGEKPKYEQKPN